MTSSSRDPRHDPDLRETDVHVHFLRLDVPDDAITDYEAMLAPDELARAARYRFARDRRRYIAARGWLREILAAYTGVRASALTFAYGAYGKPGLSNQHNTSINFNLSHSDDLAALAVTKNVRVGIDIESGATLHDCRGLASRFFHSSEVAELDSLPETEYRRAFLDAWTRKEALLKAMGTGLYTNLADIAVSLLPGEPAVIRHAPDDGRWTLCALDCGDTHAGALVTEGSAPLSLSIMTDFRRPK